MDFHLNIADKFEEYDGVEASDKDSRHKAKVKKVDEDDGKQEEKTKVEAVEDERFCRGNEGLCYLQMQTNVCVNIKHICQNKNTFVFR